jgi:hypothetical protein
MIAGVYNITCEQGSTFVRVLELEKPDLLADPTGQTFTQFDLSSYTARMQVRRTIESNSYLVELTTENSGLEINPTGDTINLIRISMSAEVTASINSSGVYDLEIINGDGFVSKVLKGAFTLVQEVTR